MGLGPRYTYEPSHVCEHEAISAVYKPCVSKFVFYVLLEKRVRGAHQINLNYFDGTLSKKRLRRTRMGHGRARRLLRAGGKVDEMLIGNKRGTVPNARFEEQAGATARGVEGVAQGRAQ